MGHAPHAVEHDRFDEQRINHADRATGQSYRRTTATRAENGRRALILDDGEELVAERLLIATGRRPRTAGVGLDALCIEPDERRAIPVDERCRAGDGVWAIGDVTGVSLFTHVDKYQARIAVDDIAGREPRADYRAIPRVVFSDPEIAAVGLNSEQARTSGVDVVEGRADLRTRPVERPTQPER